MGNPWEHTRKDAGIAFGFSTPVGTDDGYIRGSLVKVPNPSDIHHPLVRLYTGDRINLEDPTIGEELTEWRRKLLVARNPAACAMFFHTMISNFISVILRHGRSEAGLFGTCTAYYGTVEAQGHGSLHCHMLIWIKNHPSPQKMRDLMVDDEYYQHRMFTWLESLIKCEPLGTTNIVDAYTVAETHPRRHTNNAAYDHPGGRRLPQINVLMPSDFRNQYHDLVNELVHHFNWHDHTETCWKYLRRHQPRIDSNCRMRIDGSTRATSSLDPDTLSIQLRRLHPWISSYNDVIIFLMQANMDIKHIGSGEGAKALIYYITDYITKASIPAHLGLAALLYAIDRTDTKFKGIQQWSPREESGALTILVNSMLARQEISHAQVMSYLVGGGDHYTSHRYQLLHYHIFERLVLQYWHPNPVLAVSEPQRSQPLSTQSNPDNGSLSTTHLIAVPPPETFLDNTDVAPSDPNTEDTVTLALAPGSISAMTQQQDYLLRPTTPPFSSMPLYQYTGMTEKITCSAETRRLNSRTHPPQPDQPTRGRPQEDRGLFMPSHPQNTTHLLRKRVSWLIPVILNNRLPRQDSTPEEQEVRARTVLTLFVPWRSPADLKHPHETWTQAYERHAPHIDPLHSSIIHNMTVLSECKDARDREQHTRRTTVSNQPRTTSPHPPTDDHNTSHNITAPSLADYPTGLELDGPPLHVQKPPTIKTIDDLISTPARVGLDRCFNAPLSTLRSEHFGKATLLIDDDMSRIATEHTTMNKLKRKRRPSPVPNPAPTPSPASSSTGPAYHPYNHNPTIDITNIHSLQHAHATISNAFSSTNPMTFDTLHGIIRQVILEFNLTHNAEQLRAFNIVARHLCFGGTQLLMYIAGVGGTGKSYVVKAILRLFELLGRRHQVMVGAPTGAASILIDGYTIHSLLMLPQRNHTDLQPLVALWTGVLYFIIDEVSMISAPFLSEISMRLQHAKGTSGLAEDIPFGGTNMIFLGDFGQLKPVGGPCLYSHHFTTNPALTDAETQNIRGVSALKGIYLWRLITQTTVILRMNQRQQGDASYAQLLARVREGHSGQARETNTADDYAALQTRLLQNFDSETATRFRDAPIIVGLKSIRDPLNDRILHHYAASMQAEVHLYHSRDKIRNAPLTPTDRQALWDLPTSATNDVLGRLPLFPGMKVMVQENLAFTCKVVNGAIGTVRDIKYVEEDGVRFITVVYVHIPGAGKYLGPDHNDIIPIFPVPTTFSWQITPKTATARARTVQVTRTQPPLLPAYALTDYKAQGRSLDLAIVDPDSALSHQGVYVMLSRVRTMDGLAILHPFKRTKIENRISQELRQELLRLDQCDHHTRTQYYANAHQWQII